MRQVAALDLVRTITGGVRPDAAMGLVERWQMQCLPCPPSFTSMARVSRFDSPITTKPMAAPTWNKLSYCRAARSVGERIPLKKQRAVVERFGGLANTALWLAEVFSMKRLLLSLALVLGLGGGVAEARGPNSYYRPTYGGYGGYYNSPIGSGAGGYYTGFGYQPWSSFTYGSPYGGAMTSYNGGIMGPGFYLPYNYSAYTPGFYGGWGWGGGY
jgi:hypothetical protein